MFENKITWYHRYVLHNMDLSITKNTLISLYNNWHFHTVYERAYLNSGNLSFKLRGNLLCICIYFSQEWKSFQKKCKFLNIWNIRNSGIGLYIVVNWQILFIGRLLVREGLLCENSSSFSHGTGKWKHIPMSTTCITSLGERLLEGWVCKLHR